MGKAARLHRERVKAGLEKSMRQRLHDEAVEKDRLFLEANPEEAERRRKRATQALAAVFRAMI